MSIFYYNAAEFINNYIDAALDQYGKMAKKGEIEE